MILARLGCPFKKTFIRMTLAIVVSFTSAALTQAGLITSFENTDDGWVVSSENSSYAFNGFSTTEGVTDGTYSVVIAGTAAPTYGQLLLGPASTELTSLLATSSEILIDVTTNAGGFDWGTQWSAAINNAELGFVSLDGFGYTGFVGGGSSATLTWDITPAQRATLAGSTNPTELIFQVGGGGPGTFYVDNIRTTEVPEPTTAMLGWLALASLIPASRGFSSRQ